MLRIFAYILLVGLLVAGAVWLADRPGQVSIEWLGWRIEATAGLLLVIVALLIVLAVLVLRLWDAIWHAPRRLMHKRAERRRASGYRALSKGMVAVAAGDAAEAKRQARAAYGLLKDPPITLLLAAQAAQLNGDDTAAHRYFTAMLDRPETRFLGLRGLLNQAIGRGDDNAAIDLARRAHLERPDALWPAEALIDLQVRSAQWEGAAGTVNEAVKQKLIEPPVARRRLAALFTEEAKGLAFDKPDRALQLLREAVKRRPGFVPAIQLEAGVLANRGKGREARRLIEHAWGAATPGPHPLLATAYAAIEPNETPLARARRFETLAQKAPGHRESRLALAETALAAGLWGPARQALETVAREEEKSEPTRAPTARACRLMAALETGERGDANAARRWLAAAASAAPDPGWVCAGCGAALTDWQARCSQCGAFDSLDWRAAPPPPVRAIADARAATGAAAGTTSPEIDGAGAVAFPLERRPPSEALPFPAAPDLAPGAAEDETPSGAQVDAARLVN
jgi:HemY protein